MKRLIAFLLITICLTVSIAAQSSNQTKVSGSVKDPADAAVAGARIFLLNTKTRMEETTVSGVDGSFAFESVVPGDYEIRVSAEGFAVQNQAVQVTSAGINNLEISLGIGEKRVTVTAEVGQAEQTENVPQAVSVIGTNEILQRTTSV
nr:carboxypeptidase regulatory-like domain-containing protein [Acidobacteriota bacterium]